MADVTTEILPIEAGDGHRWQLLATAPTKPHSSLLWLPAMGVAAKHYRPFAEALAARGVATFVHEWRGNGSSNLRASRQQDWGYKELLSRDLPASEVAIAERFPDIGPIIGGHSLGGQLACCRLALAPRVVPSDQVRRLWLVARRAVLARVPRTDALRVATGVSIPALAGRSPRRAARPPARLRR